MKNPKSWLALILFALIAVFALQNLAVIDVNFLGFGFQTRRIFLILVCVLVGFVLGKSIRLKRR